MGRVLVEVDGLPGDALATLLGDALGAKAAEAGADGPALAAARVEILPDPPPRRTNGALPSAHYGAHQQQKLKEGRWEAVTPDDVVAWWAARYRFTFGCEDAALQAMGAMREHAAAVRNAQRRFHGGSQKALLQYLTSVLRWWRLRRDRQDQRASGFPRLRYILQSDWVLGMYRSGDIARELEGR